MQMTKRGLFGLVFVASASRNVGLGTRLLHAIFAEMKEHGGRSAPRRGAVIREPALRTIALDFIYEPKPV
jgi:GNAT superfamily N-acetyltransferase